MIVHWSPSTCRAWKSRISFGWVVCVWVDLSSTLFGCMISAQNMIECKYIYILTLPIFVVVVEWRELNAQYEFENCTPRPATKNPAHYWFVRMWFKFALQWISIVWQWFRMCMFIVHSTHECAHENKWWPNRLAHLYSPRRLIYCTPRHIVSTQIKFENWFGSNNQPKFNSNRKTK